METGFGWFLDLFLSQITYSNLKWKYKNHTATNIPKNPRLKHESEADLGLTVEICLTRLQSMLLFRQFVSLTACQFSISFISYIFFPRFNFSHYNSRQIVADNPANIFRHIFPSHIEGKLRRAKSSMCWGKNLSIPRVGASDNIECGWWRWWKSTHIHKYMYLHLYLYARIFVFFFFAQNYK